MELSEQDEPPGEPSKPHREHENLKHSASKKLSVEAFLLPTGVEIHFPSNPNSPNLQLKYPIQIWECLSASTKQNLLNNLVFAFTAHLPLLHKNISEITYSTPHPLIHPWINNLFLKFLPTYWHLYKKSPEADIIPVLQKILNTNHSFSTYQHQEIDFPSTETQNIVIPFTFGKDSLLTYLTAKSIGLNPTLVCFLEPTEKYSKQHKLALIDQFEKEHNEKIYFIENHLAQLRAPDDGWFGWETTLTTYALMALPFACYTKSQHIIFSNEISCNDSFLSKDSLKVMFDYEQSDLATQDLSFLTQSLTNQQVQCGNFLSGLYEIAIIAILKENFRPYLKYLMSCWAETPGAKHRRWCQECSKCARIFLFLAANNIDPITEAGFTDNLFQTKYSNLFSIFSTNHQKITYDSLGTNRDEQLLAFYLATKNQFTGDLIDQFKSSVLAIEAHKRASELTAKYFHLNQSAPIPTMWKNQINHLYQTTLTNTIKNLQTTHNQNHERSIPV